MYLFFERQEKQTEKGKTPKYKGYCYCYRVFYSPPTISSTVWRKEVSGKSLQSESVFLSIAELPPVLCFRHFLSRSLTLRKKRAPNTIQAGFFFLCLLVFMNDSLCD